MTAVKTGPTSIRVTWTPRTPLGVTTGYIIYYITEDDSYFGSVYVGVVGGSTDMETRTGLHNGNTYTISIVATSKTALPSESITANMSVGLRKSLFLCTYKTVYDKIIQFQIHQ